MKALKNIEVFYDGANLEEMKALNSDERVKGFTTNPTLMKKSGVNNYRGFAREVLNVIKEKPVSFEVFTDTLDEMEAEAHEISSWGPNVYVKIPIMTSEGISTVPLIKKLAFNGKINLNITAIFTPEQAAELYENVSGSKNNIIFSVFAGRIADSGVDPAEIMHTVIVMCKASRNIKILWASTREVLNVYQADSCGAHIITCSGDIIKKLFNTGKELEKISLETVEMFANDAKALGFSVFA
jgi:transaldolase